MSPIGVGVAVGEADVVGSTRETPDGDVGVPLPDIPDVFGSLPEPFDEGCIHLHDIIATRHAVANKPSLRFVIILGAKRLFRYIDLFLILYCIRDMRSRVPA